MKYKIGIFGSAVIHNEELLFKARALGKALGKYNLTLITGGGKGIPYQVVSEAKKKNGKIKIWAFPPVLDKESLKAYTTDDISIYDKITYIPENYVFSGSVHACRLYRNQVATNTCDAGIIISGRWGTLNEFTNLQEGGKVIGVLTGTGGIADELPNIVSKVQKQNTATVIFSDNSDELIQNMLKELTKRTP